MEAQNLASWDVVNEVLQRTQVDAYCTLAKMDWYTFCSHGYFWTVPAMQHNTWLHRYLLQLLHSLDRDIRLVQLDSFSDIRVEVEIDPIWTLLNLHSKEGCNIFLQCDVKIADVFPDERPLQLLAC